MRNLKNTNHDEAKANGWEIIKPLDCEVVGKAVYKKGEEAIMKSTKRFPVWGQDENKTQTLLGWIYNTTTEHHKGTEIAIAEALVFVPVK